MGRHIKHGGMSLHAITEVEGTTPGAIDSLLRKALKKLRRDGLILTARELSHELEAHRSQDHTVYRRRARKAGAE